MNKNKNNSLLIFLNHIIYSGYIGGNWIYDDY